jgi:hypothetical protein
LIDSSIIGPDPTWDDLFRPERYGVSRINNGVGITAGGTVTDNTARDNSIGGITVSCPSNVIGNTATANADFKLELTGAGCISVNNITPTTTPPPGLGP